MLNSEEIKFEALAIIELHLFEGNSQSVSQSVEILLNKKFLKFYINLVEGFMVDLKIFLGLAMLIQSCLDVTK